MWEWLKGTENIAIIVLAAGYVPAGIAIRVLWSALSDARKEAKDSLREGIELDRSYTAQLDSMAGVLSSVQTAVSDLSDAAHKRFEKIEGMIKALAIKIVSELRG